MMPTHPPHYPPFGSSLPNRSWNDGNREYRFGFNGKEKDSETASDNYDFGARIYDGRLGRWFVEEPEFKFYSSLTLFQFVNNNPILNVEINGAIFDLSNIENIDNYRSSIEIMKHKYNTP
jgi:RHS repeat-associated protein